VVALKRATRFLLGAEEEVERRKLAHTAQPAVAVGQVRQAGFGGQQVGSRPSFSALGCRCAGTEVNAALRRFLPVGKARAGLVLTGQLFWPLAGRRSLDT
jgi:hypothetical protein